MYFVLKMIWVFADKYITEGDSNRIREVLTMTKVDRILEEEKRQAIDKAVADTTESITTQIARKLLKKGNSVEDVADTTELPVSQVLQLSQSL